MITHIKGDLTKAPERVLIHGCNTLGVMGAGVAKAIKLKWPEVFKPYSDWAVRYNGNIPLGYIQAVDTGDGFHTVINAITQTLNTPYTPGRYVSYDAIDMAMMRIQKYISDFDIDPDQVAMSKIGAGLGGGDWNIISSIIQKYLNKVKVYEL